MSLLEKLRKLGRHADGEPEELPEADSEESPEETALRSILAARVQPPEPDPNVYVRVTRGKRGESEMVYVSYDGAGNELSREPVRRRGGYL